MMPGCAATGDSSLRGAPIAAPRSSVRSCGTGTAAECGRVTGFRPPAATGAVSRLHFGPPWRGGGER